MKIKYLKGFTLIELLVVIVIIGIIATLVATNLVGGRTRASDSQKKSNLNQLKTALHIYYIDYHKYPTTGNGLVLNACGTNGTDPCPVCPTADFAAGGVDGCLRIYADKIDINRTNKRFPDIRYYPCESGDDFRLKIALANTSDSDIAESQARCPACGTTYTSADYVLCGD